VLYLYVDSVRLINFRNYMDLNLELNKKVNIFIGKNAQGKTNLLESIYLCSAGKSFRTNVDKDMINIKKNQCYVGAKVFGNHIDKFIEIKLERNKPKRIKINKLELEKNRDLYGGLNVVVFSPEDLRIIKDGPSERRNFIDREISQIKPVYRYNLNRYNKILFQRNNLLKNMRMNKKNKHLIDIFNMQMVKSGSKVIIDRARFVENLALSSRKIHRDITYGKEELLLKYRTNVVERFDDILYIEKKFMEKLEKDINNDILKGTTKIGPHRDDIDIFINNMDSKTFASQGQQRTAVLSMKLAEVDIIKEEKEDFPVLLLDDVLSELDKDRRKYLIHTFRDLQTIITSTDIIDLGEFDSLEKKIFCIENGNVNSNAN